MGRSAAIFFLYLALSGCSKPPAALNRQQAIDAFRTEVEPEIASLFGGVMFDPPIHPAYTSPPHFGMQSSDAPLQGERVLREGKLPNGAIFWAEGFYSYAESRMNSITVVVDFPAPPDYKPKGNADISPDLLGKLKIHPALIDALLQGLGQGSMSGSGLHNFQARAEVGGKRFEVSTAIVRDKPLLLELSCMYFR